LTLESQVELYMRDRKLPVQLQMRLSTFYSSLISEKISNGRFLQDQVLEDLPLALRLDVTNYIYKDLIQSTRFLQALPKAVMCKIVGNMGVVPSDDQVVYRAGDIGHECFIVATGSVVLHTLFGEEMAHLGQGSLFGELGVLMPGSRRMYTAKLLRGSTVRSMSRAMLEPHMCEYPELAHELYRQYLSHAYRQLMFLTKSRARMEPEAVLRITVVEASDLLAMDLFGKSDPYCVIKYQVSTHMPESVHRARAHRSCVHAPKAGGKHILEIQKNPTWK
jgi:CRP-like cAMP-binding protein